MVYTPISEAILIVGGLDSQEMVYQELFRSGKAMQYCSFDVQGKPHKTTKHCHAQYFHSWVASDAKDLQSREDYLKNLKLRCFTKFIKWCPEALFAGAYLDGSTKGDIWQLGGWIGFLEHPDERMHELFMCRYNTETRKGVMVVFCDDLGRQELLRQGYIRTIRDKLYFGPQFSSQEMDSILGLW